MKKAIIAIVLVLIVAGGGYALTRNGSTGESSSGSAAQTSNATKQSQAPAVNNAVLKTKTDSTIGQYLTDPSGKTLYTYNADTKGVSNCTGSCLAAWPAYVDKGATTGLPSGVGTIKRSDNGQVQYTYNGLPLYYFASDTKGQVTGDGVDNFSVARPAASASSTSGSSGSTGSSSTGSSTGSSSPNYPY